MKPIVRQRVGNGRSGIGEHQLAKKWQERGGKLPFRFWDIKREGGLRDDKHGGQQSALIPNILANVESAQKQTFGNLGRLVRAFSTAAESTGIPLAREF